MQSFVNLKKKFSPLCAALFLLLSVIINGNKEARADSEQVEYPNKISLFGGVTQEDSDLDGTIAFEYERLLNKHLGIGVVISEFTRGSVERSWLIAVPAFIHPYAGSYLVLGPGVEFEGSESIFIFRAGVGYDFEFLPRWSIAPEFNVDFVSGGETKLVYGLALSYSF